MKHIHGGDIYNRSYELDFSANLNPLGMPERVKEAAMQGVERSEAYPDPQQRKLRAAIAARDKVDPAQVICGNGAAELIFLVCDALRPKKALLVQPGFAEYEQALEKTGAKIGFYPCDAADGFRVKEDYLTMLTGDTDIAFLCNPNNPTGTLLDPALLDRVIDHCKEQKILLVLDECFIPLTGQGDLLSQKHRLAGNPYLMILRAFTKLYAMAGLRLGYALCDNGDLLERMRLSVQPWSVSVPAQMAGVAALAETDYEHRSRTYITRERAWLCEALQGLGLLVYPPSANFIFLQGPADLGEQCARRGILLRDCSNYRGLGKGYWRVAVRTREENERLVEVIRAALAGE